MTDVFFKQGSLVMSSEPIPPVAEDVVWTGDPVNRVLVVVSVLLILFTLKAFIQILPSLRECLFFGRGTLDLEHSVSKARLRNISALSFAFPFFLIADRFALLRFGFAAAWPPRLSLPLTAGFFLAYVLLRRLLFAVFGPRHTDYDGRQATHNTLYSFFVLLCTAMLITLLFIGVFDLQAGTVRLILAAEIAFFYLFAMFRTVQVLASRCRAFSVILFFFVLELVPAAAAVTAYLRFCS